MGWRLSISVRAGVFRYRMNWPKKSPATTIEEKIQFVEKGNEVITVARQYEQVGLSKPSYY